MLFRVVVEARPLHAVVPLVDQSVLELQIFERETPVLDTRVVERQHLVEIGLTDPVAPRDEVLRQKTARFRVAELRFANERGEILVDRYTIRLLVLYLFDREKAARIAFSGG